MKNMKCRHTNVERKIAIIKEFATKMGYTADVYETDLHRVVELIGTEDSEGNPYSWAWDLKTGREV